MCVAVVCGWSACTCLTRPAAVDNDMTPGKFPLVHVAGGGSRDLWIGLVLVLVLLTLAPTHPHTHTHARMHTHSHTHTHINPSPKHVDVTHIYIRGGGL